MNNIPFNKPFIVGQELYNIAQAVINGHLSGDGKYSLLCHQWMEEKLNIPKALLTHSCTAALEMAAMLTNIEPGDEVIMPSYSFVSTANAFVLRGAVPVFVDIRPDTLNINENLIEDAITPKTKAIVPVHYAGIACEMDTITTISKNHNLTIIEDAAQALLATYKEKYLGTIGDIACTSFHETKNFISGEGGAIFINNPTLIERSMIIREKGTNRPQFFRKEVEKYTWVDIGSSFLPSELIGAFLWPQLENSEVILKKRLQLFSRYSTGLESVSKINDLRTPVIPEDCTINAHMFYLITRNESERTELLHYLNQKGVGAIFHYIPLHSSPAGTKHARSNGTMKVTDEVSTRIVRLPLFYEMTMDMVDKIVDLIEVFYSSA